MEQESKINRDLTFKVNNLGVAGVESMGYGPAADTRTTHTVNRVMAATENLVRDLKSNNVISQSARIDQVVGTESVTYQTEATVGMAKSALHSYAHSITDNPERADNVMSTANAYLIKNSGDRNLAFNRHFRNVGERSSDLQNRITTTMADIYAPGLRSGLAFNAPNFTPNSAMEAFGADIDDLATDVKAGLTVNVAHNQTALTNKLVHVKNVVSPYVSYSVVYGQVYDMLKSNDPSGDVRNHGEHLKPFIDLEFDPRDVANELRPIIAKKSNDTKNVVYKDGYIVPGAGQACLMDLAMNPTEFGNNHINYTDIVADNVVLKSLVVELKTNGSYTHAANKTELIEIPLDNRNGTRLMMNMDTVDSGIRSAIGTHKFRLTKDNTKLDGGASEILAKCTNDDLISLDIMLSAVINLKTSDFRVAASPSVGTFTRNETVHPDVGNLAKNLTVKVLGVAVSANYSEENVRKSNVAVRTNTRQFTFEVSNGRNFLIDYSLVASSEDEAKVNNSVLQYAIQAGNNGVDNTAIRVIVDQLKWVYARNTQENRTPGFYHPMERINYTCVAGMEVCPTSLLGTIDLTKIQTIRSSDITGDIRGAVEYDLLSLFAQFYQNSLYRKRLEESNETPRFRVLTSPLVLTTIFNVPHIHPHLNTNDSFTSGADFVYRRELGDGTVLEFVTTNFDMMRDKIIIVPFRQDPNDVTSFGINADYGTYVANYNPQYENAVNKRLLTNSRSMVIPTNPSGMYLSVAGLDELANLRNEVAKINETLPDPADLLNKTGNL